MSEVTAETITPRHVKAARALLDWTAADLARESNLGVTTIRKWEAGTDVRLSSVAAIFETLTGAGIEFQNGGQPGARLMKKSNAAAS